MLPIRRRVCNLMSTCTTNPQALVGPSTTHSSPSRRSHNGTAANRGQRNSCSPRRGYSPSWPVDSSSPPPVPEWRAKRHVPGAFKHYDHHYQQPDRRIRSQTSPDGLNNSNDAFSNDFERQRRVKSEPPMVKLPPDDYLQFAKPTPENKDSLISDDIVPKLLVLDLNGALIYRRRSSGATPLPRPYLACFLEYLFLPEPKQNDSPRPWEVFVWSSAQPHNVRAMVEACFGQRWIEGVWEDQPEEKADAMEAGEGRLIGVWARDKMGLSGLDYSRKVQTTKNLNLVIDHLNQSTHLGRPLSFSQKTTVLLDDSPLKAVFQPWSQIVIPEFDEHVNFTSRLAAGIQSGPGATPSKEERPDGSMVEMDDVLLAVVGILDELRYVPNVPFWVRSGGLDLALNVDTVEEPTVDTLPSHETFEHWYKDKDLHAKWVAKGKEALGRKGIEVRHGLVPSAPRSPGSPMEPPSPREPHSEPRLIQSDISPSTAKPDMAFGRDESAFARRKRLAEERAAKEAAGIPLTAKEKKEAKKAQSKAHILVDEEASQARQPAASLPHRPVANQRQMSHQRSNPPVRQPAFQGRQPAHRVPDWNHPPRRDYHGYNDSFSRIQGALPPRPPSPAHGHLYSSGRERSWSPPRRDYSPPPPASYAPPQQREAYAPFARGPQASAEEYYFGRHDWRDHGPPDPAGPADSAVWPVSSWRPTGERAEREYGREEYRARYERHHHNHRR
ncbi:hypothetical protein IAR50_003438 [Cryptococcus sp. DSM 104548]